MNAPIQPSGQETVEVRVANLSAEDAKFLRNCIALLTDPGNGQHMADVRSGQSHIQYGPRGGLNVIGTQRKS